jgi:adenine-specific DNA-methyltransferase
MNKLKMHSSDLTQANIDKLAELFPNCVAEAAGADGVLKRSIDFDQLRQELSGSIVEGPQERYQLNWPGKREALLTANAPIAKTLRPCREESVDFDTTKNLFIEGDNLDALKLLQETYLNKVKMIYIDPPYNTGNDFIYEDDFAEETEAYKLRSNQKDSLGNRLVANTLSNGRFHSDWLSMIYSRLKLSRNLLQDDGLVFISIDDVEIHNIRAVCNEIFGEDNFFAEMVWKNKTGGGAKTKGWIGLHEYILCYARNIHAIDDVSIQYSEKTASMYNKKDDKYSTRGPYATWPLDTTSMGDRPNLKYPIQHNGEEIWPKKQWLWSRERVLEAQRDNMLQFTQQSDGGWKVRFKGYLRNDDGVMRRGKPLTLLDGPYTQEGSKDFQALIPKDVFPFPKPVQLIRQLLSVSTQDGRDVNFTVLDFFAGAATTAQAVMSLNAEDGGKRNFIMIQLPETCEKDSGAAKAGFGTVAEISKERIRKAGSKIKQDNSGNSYLDKLDVGFRVLKVDSSNMKEVFYTPDANSQDLLSDQVNNIREDRTAEDLLFQVLLDWGVDLALPISREAIAGKTVYFVDADVNGKPALAACFDVGVSEDFVKLLAKREPLRVVFRDAGLASDSVKINVEQIFKLMSPSTEVKTI